MAIETAERATAAAGLVTATRQQPCALPVEHDWERAAVGREPASACRRCGLLTAGTPATAAAVWAGEMLAEAREAGGTVKATRERFSRLRATSDAGS